MGALPALSHSLKTQLNIEKVYEEVGVCFHFKNTSLAPPVVVVVVSHMKHLAVVLCVLRGIEILFL